MWWKVFLAMMLVVVMAGCKMQQAGEPKGAPDQPAVEAGQTKAEAGEAAWGTSLAAAQEQARVAGKTVLVDFCATWCGPCKKLEETWAEPQVAAALRDFITVKIDVDEQPGLATQYNIEAIPAVVFLSPEGKEKHRNVGYMDAAAALKLLEKYR